MRKVFKLFLVSVLCVSFNVPTMAEVGGTITRSAEYNIMPINYMDTADIIESVINIPDNLASLDIELDGETMQLLNNLIATTQDGIPELITVLNKIKGTKDFNSLLKVATDLVKSDTISDMQKEVLYSTLYTQLKDYIQTNGVPSLDYLNTLNINSDTVNALKQVIAVRTGK